MVMNMNNNTLETHEKITLNKDNDIHVGESQILVMWQCISITMPLAKQVHLCKMYACPSSFVPFLELLMHAF